MENIHVRKPCIDRGFGFFQFDYLDMYCPDNEHYAVRVINDNYVAENILSDIRRFLNTWVRQ